MQQWGAHFTCLAPDSPGFGQSDPLPGAPEIGDFARALDEFLIAVGVERCAAYGFHSGSVILAEVLKQAPGRFSALALGGYTAWTQEEKALFGGEHYLTQWHPSAYGEHLTWVWNRMLEQSWFFPWFDMREEKRLSVAHADPSRVHGAVMDMLDAGDHYRAGYGAVLRAAYALPGAQEEAPACLISAYNGDPLQSHIDRFAPLPRNWHTAKVRTPQEHTDGCLAFLQKHCDCLPCPKLAEDDTEGWLSHEGGLIHWRGEPGGALRLHLPAREMDAADRGEIDIDVAGHGLSSTFADMRGAITAAASVLGNGTVIWPAAPLGEPERLYPDVAPDRFGAHLLAAWGAARAEALFNPWYEASAGSAIPLAKGALEPEAISARARARLRAGKSARVYHQLLEEMGETQ